MRTGTLSRITLETNIEVSVCLDGRGAANVELKPEFMRHMIVAMAVHGGLDISLRADGDLQHHIIEDVALCLGKLVRECIDKGGAIRRYGHAIVPMDCSLAMVAVDICNRPHAVVELDTSDMRVEDTQIEDIVHFFGSFASALQATIHTQVLYGLNSHHKIEAAFKGLGIALREALQIRETDQIPVSSKGML